MGLDISAYSELEKIDSVDEDGELVIPGKGYAYRLPNVTTLSDSPVFPQQAEHYANTPYSAYSYKEAVEFRAGSYSGYNNWRHLLAKLAGYSDEDAFRGLAKNRPFNELVNFSDCEGIIGPKTSAKLAKDFAAFDEAARKWPNDQDCAWFYEKYAEWHKAFVLAANNGAVEFH
jgi:hypothetical protein